MSELYVVRRGDHYYAGLRGRHAHWTPTRDKARRLTMSEAIDVVERTETVSSEAHEIEGA